MEGISIVKNSADRFREKYTCKALDECIIAGPDAMNNIFAYTVHLQKILTMVHIDEENDYVTAMQMCRVTGSHMYLPFYYEDCPVLIK